MVKFLHISGINEFTNFLYFVLRFEKKMKQKCFKKNHDDRITNLQSIKKIYIGIYLCILPCLSSTMIAVPNPNDHVVHTGQGTTRMYHVWHAHGVHHIFGPKPGYFARYGDGVVAHGQRKTYKNISYYCRILNFYLQNISKNLNKKYILRGQR